jgi:hypothetical protein
MAKNYKDINYFVNRPEVVDIFDVLEGYLDWCRFEMCEYDPSHYSVKGSHHPQFRAYQNSKRPRKPYLGNKPRFNNTRRNEQNFSR